jgi:23S rRNA (cytidine1920-2'-O)/16S rRNA (cytidine1409-2'-O)-methyltransferase
MGRTRLDTLLAEKGLIESRSRAQRVIMAGQVRVDGVIVLKPSVSVSEDSIIEILQSPRYVSRGGEKLEAALAAFSLDDLAGEVCVDVGASTGGFTDCLLQHGAERVYAVDVGYGILHWNLRQDERVVSMERTNAREVRGFPETISLVTVDASFISLKILLPVVKTWFGKNGGKVIALIKPQFEAGRKEAARGKGIIRDPEIHRAILIDVLNFARSEGYSIQGLILSPLKGPKGNIEFLSLVVYPSDPQALNIEDRVAQVLQDCTPQPDENTI